MIEEEVIWRESLDEALRLYEDHLADRLVEARRSVECHIDTVRLHERRIKESLMTTEKAVGKLEKAAKERDRLTEQLDVIARFLFSIGKRRGMKEHENGNEGGE